MKRAFILICFTLLMFGTWFFLKSKASIVRVSPPSNQVPAEEILWSPDGAQVFGGGGGDDPRAVFSRCLERYLAEKVNQASPWPIDRVDPTVEEVSDQTARLKATVQGVRYHGVLKWGSAGWEMVQISREK